MVMGAKPEITNARKKRTGRTPEGGSSRVKASIVAALKERRMESSTRLETRSLRIPQTTLPNSAPSQANVVMRLIRIGGECNS